MLAIVDLLLCCSLNLTLTCFNPQQNYILISFFFQRKKKTLETQSLAIRLESLQNPSKRFQIGIFLGQSVLFCNFALQCGVGAAPHKMSSGDL
jgi:hypothetical protein